MTALAPLRGSLRPPSTLNVLIALIGLSSAAPAGAQIGATASIWSEERLRSYSLSAGHPVARLDLSYDDASGFYGALSGSVVYSKDYHLKPLDLHENIGFSKQLSSGPTIDVGLHNANYSKYSSPERSVGYTEAYAGLIGKWLSGRVYLSPNYFHANTWRLYGELEGSVRPMRKLSVSAHVGVRAPLHDPSDLRPLRRRTQYDWRVGAAQEVGRVALHADLSGGGPDKDRYEGGVHNRTALVAGASFIF